MARQLGAAGTAGRKSLFRWEERRLGVCPLMAAFMWCQRPGQRRGFFRRSAGPTSCSVQRGVWYGRRLRARAGGELSLCGRRGRPCPDRHGGFRRLRPDCAMIFRSHFYLVSLSSYLHLLPDRQVGRVGAGRPAVPVLLLGGVGGGDRAAPGRGQLGYKV